MIVRYYEGFKYKIVSLPAGYSYRLKPPKKRSRWITSKGTYSTREQARNAALEEISRAVFSVLLSDS